MNTTLRIFRSALVALSLAMLPADVHPAAPPDQAPTGGAQRLVAKDVDLDTTARVYRVRPRAYDSGFGQHLMKRLEFKSALAPEKTRWGALVWHDTSKDAHLTFDPVQSEWSYFRGTVPPLSPRAGYSFSEKGAQALAQRMVARYLPEKKEAYYFVNHEITRVTVRDSTHVCGAKPPRPAYFVGRFLTKVDNRVVLGDKFQLRIGGGGENQTNLISLREASLSAADSSARIPVPRVEAVWKYLRDWRTDPGRLGRRIYPYHPDSLRIVALKPQQVVESYILLHGRSACGDVRPPDTTCLVPRVTVVAEAVLNTCQSCSKPKDCWEMAKIRGWKSRGGRRHAVPDTGWEHPELQTSPPLPEAPVLLHFHFPCTPEAGLCWPDKDRLMFRAPEKPSAEPPQPMKVRTPARPTPSAPKAPAPSR